MLPSWTKGVGRRSYLHDVLGGLLVSARSRQGSIFEERDIPLEPIEVLVGGPGPRPARGVSVNPINSGDCPLVYVRYTLTMELRKCC